MSSQGYCAQLCDLCSAHDYLATEVSSSWNLDCTQLAKLYTTVQVQLHQEEEEVPFSNMHIGAMWPGSGLVLPWESFSNDYEWIFHY